MQSPDSSASRGRGGPTALLLVDDDPAVLAFLRRCLVAEGYDCDTAQNAEQAWARLDVTRHCLILSDVNMPGRSGIELLEQVRATYGDTVATVVITGMDDKEVGIRAVELGAYSYLAKPFSTNEVAIHVASALERRRLVRDSLQFQERLGREVLAAQEEIGWRLLAAVRWRDEETGEHISRVGRGTRALGRRLGWDRERLEWAELAAALHDIGKIAIPDAVLRKPGPLTAAEFRQVRRHTVVGSGMLAGSSNPLLEMAREIARSHHERWDGRGYPDGLRRQEIPEAARVVSVLDVFDALTSDRPYRRALREHEALEIMQHERRRHFDPEIFDAFVEALPELRGIAAACRASSRIASGRELVDLQTA